MDDDPDKPQTITLGAGCFWCVEAVFQQIEGVQSAISGYMGGHLENPTYQDICTKKSGHIEVVQVTFLPSTVHLDDILKVFWQSHDPTQANGQGADIGPQYLSVIFTHNADQRAAAEASKQALQETSPKPIATEIRDATVFYPAEEYHQNYYSLNKSKNPYCQIVISPKLRKLGLPE